jgi:hypothetical protein
VGHIACIDEAWREENVYKDLIGNPEGKGLLERSRYS